MQRTTCSACGDSRLVKFLDLGNSPIADAYTAHANEPMPTYPLEVAVCATCDLVQLLEVVDAKTLFGTGYSFFSSASPPLSRYHETYADSVLTLFPDLAKRLTVEVGCNDGDMLRWFAQAGCRHVGVDPAVGPVTTAFSHGIDVMNSEFNMTVAREIITNFGQAGVIIANHVLAHVADVGEVLQGISELLAPDGVAFIEVQYLPDLLVNNAFDLVYHEHRNFFSLTTLRRAANRWGLSVVDVKVTSRQGGSLRVMLQHGVVNTTSVTDAVAERLRAETWLTYDEGAYAGVQGRVNRIKQRLHDELAPFIGGEDVVLAGYGAPAKATTLLHFCGLAHGILNHVVDTTPAKQGRYVPGTDAQIISPSDAEKANAYLLLAWNYAREIIANNRRPDLSWIVPIPAPMTL